jgi:uncharacterized membrane protein
MPTALWTEEQLAALKVRDGFRLRGAELNRLESLTDAAFALALTFLVISTQQVPQSYDELMRAFKQVPAFAASFLVLMTFWHAHVRWSRRYGLEDRASVWLTSLMVLTILVFVYPLKILFATWFAALSGGWLPEQISIDTMLQLRGLFVAYGIGFLVLSVSRHGLYAHAMRCAEALRLNELERFDTVTQLQIGYVLIGVGLLATLWPLVSSDALAQMSGWSYCILPVALSLLSRRRNARRRNLLEPGASA